jgi:hypothetical protein
MRVCAWQNGDAARAAGGADAGPASAPGDAAAWQARLLFAFVR